jgi:ribosomal protein S15P/S13E
MVEPENLEGDRKQIEVLKARRNQLFARLEKNPKDTHLAPDIKAIDDQIAELIKQMNRKKKSAPTSR